MPKNIIILSDGTGQEGGEGNNTNIYKLFNMLVDRTPGQMVFYDRGVGTGARKYLGMITGLGFSKNVQDGYRFIFDHYEAGDRVFLFGFSRGAATVRSLSSFIHYFGILPQSRPELITKAYKIYKIKNDARRKCKADEFIAKHHTMWIRVKFMGCYDTVAALGLPIPFLCGVLDRIPLFWHRFHDFRLSECVEHAYHALAIDDQRKVFHPVLWDVEKFPHQSVKQVWFCGMHTDVGGGYKEQTLSDIPLEWMVDMAKQHGLKIYPKNKVPIQADVNGIMHDSRGTWLSKIYTQQQRSWDAGRPDKPIIHESVFKRTKNINNTDEPPYLPWIKTIDHEVETGGSSETENQ